jgi:hypothetical protein
MPYAALELNDASLAIARDGKLVLPGPGYAAAAGGTLHFGDDARGRIRAAPRQASRRYWSELSESPLPQPILACTSSADLVHAHLARLWELCAGSDGAVLATMPGWSAAQLGLLLGIARDIGMPVAGLVDPAVAASRSPYAGRALWHLHATLDAAWVTRIEQNGGAALGQRERIERCGAAALERGCAEFLARRFVECSRFDPLHDAASEQQLYDRLPAWLAAAARQERVDLSLEHHGNRFDAWTGATDLRSCVGRVCEPLTRTLRGLVSPREPSVLLVHHRLADFPGFIDLLARLPACVPVLLEPGAAARGALRVRAAGGNGAGLRLITALPWDQAAGEIPGSRPAAAPSAPTHVVFAGRAWRLGEEPVQIGTALDSGEYGILVEARVQAVSRRHCTIRMQDGQAVLHDQSRYGTLLNGHRIEGSAVLQAGDVLSIGQPALDFDLIAEVGRGP